MSNGPEVWIRQGYDLALAGEPVPVAIGAYVGSWMQIGHDLAGRLADNQIEEIGAADPMPLPAWPELAQQAIKENQTMSEARPQNDIPAVLRQIAKEAQRQAEENAEHTANLVRELNQAKSDLSRAMIRIEELYQDRTLARRGLRETQEGNQKLRADYEALKLQIARVETVGDAAAAMIANLTDWPGSPRVIFYRAGGDPDAITAEIVSPTGHVYAGANGRSPAAALQEAIQRYERTRRGDNGRPIEHPDAGQEAEEAADAAEAGALQFL